MIDAVYIINKDWTVRKVEPVKQVIKQTCNYSYKETCPNHDTSCTYKGDCTFENNYEGFFDAIT